MGVLGPVQVTRELASNRGGSLPFVPSASGVDVSAGVDSFCGVDDDPGRGILKDVVPSFTLLWERRKSSN